MPGCRISGGYRRDIAADAEKTGGMYVSMEVIAIIACGV